MKILLSKDWNQNIAINEMVGSFFLCLFVFLSFYSVRKYKESISLITQRLLLSVLFCISTLLAILITKSFAYHMGDEAEGIALLNPGFVIMYAIKFNEYAAVWYLILFQVIGTVIGFIIYVLFLFANKELNFIEYLFQSKGSKIQYTLKEIFFILLLYIFIGLITTLGPNYNAGMESINLFSIIICLFILFFISSQYGFFNFSAAIQIANYGFFVLINLFSNFKNYNRSIIDIQTQSTYKLIRTQSTYNLISFITYFGGAVGIGFVLQLMVSYGGGYA